MRCSRCAMPLSPKRANCPRCGTAVAAMSEGQKGQGELPFSSMQTSSEYKPVQNSLFAKSAGFAGTPVDVTPAQPQWEPHSSNVQNMPLAAALVPPATPPTPVQQEPQAFSFMPPSPKRGNHIVSIGFGLAGLCTTIACLLLLFVYFMAQSLPLPATTLSSHLAVGPSSLPAQNTPVIDLSPTATASPTASYPGKQYIANAKTASAINGTTGQPTLPTTIFQVGQKMYVTFDVHPGGQVGAICLLWFINGTQFANYPFALTTTSTTSAYSYATTGNAGPGYIEIYWENAPSCTDPNKILGDHIDFTVTA